MADSGSIWFKKYIYNIDLVPSTFSLDLVELFLLMLATIASSYYWQLFLAIKSVFRRLTIRPTDCENLPGIWTQNLLIYNIFISPCLKHASLLHWSLDHVPPCFKHGSFSFRAWSTGEFLTDLGAQWECFSPCFKHGSFLPCLNHQIFPFFKT